MSANIVTVTQGNPQATYKVASTDAAQSLTRVAGAIGAVISCETNSIRYAFDETPTNDAGTALGHVLVAGDYLILNSGAEVKDFKFISKVGTVHGSLQITQYKAN
jgi:hypothetical protein